MKNAPIIFIISLCLGLVIASVSMSAAPVFDNRLYAELLSKYVKKGVVNYGGFKKEENKFNAYLKLLESADTEKMSEKERFAFYINAYNAWTIKLILSGYPGIKSIKDMGSFFTSPWNKKICRIHGKILTLDDIENRILRKEFKDPRVHFAIVCASKGCPDLSSMPYQSSTIDKQLDAAVRAFVNNRKKNYIIADKLYISKIFKWFSQDFSNDIVAFFNRYAAENFKEKISAESGNIKIKYLDYDWSLNGY